MKVHPLKIEAWGEDGEDLVSRGHHAPVAFLAAAVRYLREQGDISYQDTMTATQRRAVLSCGRHDCSGWFTDHPHGQVDWLDPDQAAGCRRLRKVKHEWWRWLPPRPDTGSEWDGMRYAKVVDGPGPGVFPVTIVRLG
jgi:hypothetical protein